MHEPAPISAQTRQPDPSASVAAGHELTSVHARAVGIFIVWFIGSACVMFVLIWLVFGGIVHHLRSAEPGPSPIGSDLTSTSRPPVDQPLQPSPGHASLPWQDITAMKAAQNQTLNSYARIAHDSSHARIPIDRAMELLLRNRSLAAPPTAGHVPSTQPYINTTQPAPTENRT